MRQNLRELHKRRSPAGVKSNESAAILEGKFEKEINLRENFVCDRRRCRCSQSIAANARIPPAGKSKNQNCFRAREVLDVRILAAIMRGNEPLKIK